MFSLERESEINNKEAKMKKKIYLFRHGTTRDNSAGRFSGWRDVSLDEKGERDAKIVALRLMDKKIDIAFQTRLKRSQETLKEVLRFHPECSRVIVDDRMIERNYGRLQGKTHLEIVQEFGTEKYDKWHRGWNNRAAGGESLSDVEKRVKKFIGDLLKMIKKEKVNVAISAHGNSMRVFRKYFEKLSIPETCKMYNDYEMVYEYEVGV